MSDAYGAHRQLCHQFSCWNVISTRCTTMRLFCNWRTNKQTNFVFASVKWAFVIRCAAYYDGVSYRWAENNAELHAQIERERWIDKKTLNSIAKQLTGLLNEQNANLNFVYSLSASTAHITNHPVDQKVRERFSWAGIGFTSHQDIFDLRLSTIFRKRKSKQLRD